MKSLVLLKALSDESRINIFRLLLERDAYIEVISERLKLAPSTVSFHLKKLVEAGLVSSKKDQYYTIYSAVSDFAEMTLKDLVLEAGVKLKEQDKVEEQYKDKVLKSFFKYGKLTKIPSQKMKREWVLARVSENLAANKSYTPPELKDLLAEIYPDPGLLITELSALGFIKSQDGKYKRS
ncbi:metalloregulator ArsR/SmtB family transcription factor [Bdellovibrio sp. HCB274]|uniref:metalloregulator ArsR/SmtB family transcription factor n=1 Tax=Bdellovibrio sp. HCB274 TaxID=3394361 RepID=UPI0039B43639